MIFQVFFKLLFQAVEAGEVENLRRCFGLWSRLLPSCIHISESCRADLLALNLGFSGIHHGIVYLPCARVGLSFSAFPFLVPLGNRLAAFGRLWKITMALSYILPAPGSLSFAAFPLIQGKP